MIFLTYPTTIKFIISKAFALFCMRQSGRHRGMNKAKPGENCCLEISVQRSPFVISTLFYVCLFLLVTLLIPDAWFVNQVHDETRLFIFADFHDEWLPLITIIRQNAHTAMAFLILKKSTAAWCWLGYIPFSRKNVSWPGENLFFNDALPLGAASKAALDEW